MNLERELAIQDMKREYRKHMAEEHDSDVPLDEIEIFCFETSCKCNVPLDIDIVNNRAKCPKCGEVAINYGS